MKFQHLVFLAQFLVIKFYKLLKSKILEQGKEKKNVRNYYRYFIGSLVNRVGNIQYVWRRFAPVIGYRSCGFCYSSVNRKKSSLVFSFELTGNKLSGVTVFTQPRFGFEARFFSLLNFILFRKIRKFIQIIQNSLKRK